MSTAPANDGGQAARRRRRIARVIAASWLVLGLALGLASCTAVLDLDAYGNVAEEMCSLLDRCYAKSENVACRPILEGHLDEADSTVRQRWLYSFTTFGCLESCSAGRHCLNIAPLCATSGSCFRRQDCCGFLDGNASCVGHQCCQTRGSSCAGDTDCCPGAGACLEGVCGGTPCREATAECATDAECCTKICKHGKCSETICEDDNAACAVDHDCCSQFCDPTTKICARPPTCAAVDAACVADTDCCAGSLCVIASGNLAGTCQSSTCSPLDIDCSDDHQCCSGHCDRQQFFCAPACVAEASACSKDTDCCAGTCAGGLCAGACSTTVCTQSADCCSKSCVDNVCAAACSTPTIHPTCLTGGRLSADDAPSECVTAVCKADPYCCCGAWDDLCVTAAQAQKNICTDVCN